MIRTAEPDMLTALRRIWKISFGDSDTYLDFLFARLIRAENILTHIDRRGRPVAMLCLQPATLEIPGGASTARPDSASVTPGSRTGQAEQPEKMRLPVSYIYGVATLPESRGRGLSSALLQAAWQRLESEGAAASVLVPASGVLSEFYAKRGYENFFFHNQSSFSATRLEEAASRHNPWHCELFPANLPPLALLRQQYFGDSRALVVWPEDFMACIDGECRLSSGETLRFCLTGPVRQRDGGQEGYAVCYRQGRRILIKEYAGPIGTKLSGPSPAGLNLAGRSPEDLQFDAVLTALHQHFRAEEYLFSLRADGSDSLAVQPADQVAEQVTEQITGQAASNQTSTRSFGMIRWFGKPAGIPPTGPLPYLAHALD